MAYVAKMIGSVDGFGDIYQVAAPLDKQLEAFGRVGVTSLAEPDEVAQIRLAGRSNDFSRTNVAPIVRKGAKTILVRGVLNPLRNPLMAVAAVEAHRKGDYFEMQPDIYEAAEAVAKAQETMAPEDMDAIFVSQEGDFDLTSEHAEAQFLLRRQASSYFKQKTNGKIPFCGLSTNKKGIAVVNYVWFGDPQNGSLLNCRGRNLDNYSHAFGVRYFSGEASAQNLGYTLTEIGKANSQVIPAVLNEAGLSGIAEKVTLPLSKGLIERLRTG
ncbi:MAG: hypothetical protein KKE05_01970 [Nanoarchaeota archaeon]|nr:hypothetical protein [Nanoarchaeota archaeon]